MSVKELMHATCDACHNLYPPLEIPAPTAPMR
jgi:hypothetical protein